MRSIANAVACSTRDDIDALARALFEH